LPPAVKDESACIDASMHGLAAVLVQVVENKEKPIAYYSCQTTPAESRYHSFELETLAVIKAVKRFRHYLLGHSFTLITDCNSLKTALEKKELNARIARWIIALQEFDFTTVHKPGTHLGFADALSRNPIPGSSLNVHIISPVDWISAAQSQDKSITSIIEIIMTGEHFAHKDLFNKYGVKGGRLYYNSSEGQKLVLPIHCRWQILRVTTEVTLLLIKLFTR
jgi:hypothetical protein